MVTDYGQIRRILQTGQPGQRKGGAGQPLRLVHSRPRSKRYQYCALTWSGNCSADRAYTAYTAYMHPDRPICVILRTGWETTGYQSRLLALPMGTIFDLSTSGFGIPP